MSTFGHFTVARTSVKRVLNASGVLASVAANTPAFEFNADGSYQGMLIEPAGTNLTIRSQELDTWTQTRVTVTANATSAPDGTTTAEKLLDTVDANTHFLFRTSTVVNATVHTLSVFAKAGEYDFLRLEQGNNSNGAYFNLATGEVVGATTYNPTITSYGNGWYRCTATVTSISTALQFVLAPSPNGTSINFTGTGTSGIFIWGAQLETGSVATSYIPTVASTETRTADSVTLTGASSLIGQTQGYVAGTFVAGAPSGALFRTVFSLGIDANNAILARLDTSNQLNALIVVGGGAQATFTSSALVAGTTYGFVMSYSAGATLLSLNGVQVGTTDLSATIPANTRVDIGQTVVSGAQLNGHSKGLILGSTALSIATANALSLSLSQL